MQQNWGRILAVFGLLLFLLPRMRRTMFGWVLRNNTLRNVGIQSVLAFPFLRERMLNRILPSRKTY